MRGSMFIHLNKTDSNSFLFVAGWYSIVYMYHIFFIHSSDDGNLSCFLLFVWIFAVFVFQFQFSSVTQSCPTLQHHGLQHAWPPWLSPTLGACSNSCPPSWWWHPTISPSVIPFSSYLQSFPGSGYFQMSQFFTSGGQSIGFSFLPMNIQDWFPLGWTGCISLQSKDYQESSPTPQFKSINSSELNFLYRPTLTSIHDYWKNNSFD